MTTKNKSIAEVVPQFRINQQKGSALHVCGACGAQIEQPMPARGKPINGKKVGPWWHRNTCKGAADCDAPMVYDWSCLLSSVMEQSLPMVQTSRQCANDE